MRTGILHRRGTNRFDGASPDEATWHAHAGGQFILVETGISHLRTELGAWIIPARRVAWVPPGVRHASRSSGGGSGWVVIAPLGLHHLPAGVCVLRASALMMASLQRLTQLTSNDASMRRLLWKVVAAEMTAEQAEQLEVPHPTAPALVGAGARRLAASHRCREPRQAGGTAGHVPTLLRPALPQSDRTAL